MLDNILDSVDEENELALERRQTLLERVMQRLRELIVESQRKGYYDMFMIQNIKKQTFKYNLIQL